jgi:hypothetical protein
MNNETIQAQEGGQLGLLMLTCKCVVTLAVFSLALAACLFVPAGTLNWAVAWVYIGVFTLGGIICTPILLRVNPEVVTERLRLRKRSGKERDVLLASMMGAFWICGVVTAGVGPDLAGGA